MKAIQGTVQNGRIELDAPRDWPEGCPVLIKPVPLEGMKVGLDESEWQDTPAILADWDSWLTTIEPLEFTPEEKVAMAQFNEEMRRFNLEAVRRQMEEGHLP